MNLTYPLKSRAQFVESFIKKASRHLLVARSPWAQIGDPRIGLTMSSTNGGLPTDSDGKAVSCVLETLRRELAMICRAGRIDGQRPGGFCRGREMHKIKSMPTWACKCPSRV